MSQEVLKTPLYEKHCELGARFVPFAGYEMPVQYSSVIEEHLAVRKSAGIFDVSHMAPMKLKGPGVLAMLQFLTSNNVDVECGRARYTLVMNESGGVRDDIIVYRESVDTFFCVVNASNAYKIKDYFSEHLRPGDKLEFLRDRICIISVQGPNAWEIVSSVVNNNVGKVKRWWFTRVSYKGTDVMIARTGYTGEDGFEIFVDASVATDLWNELMNAGKKWELVPCGLGARDTLRLEKGFPLYGHELTEERSPVECSLERFVDTNKNFVGKDIIMQHLAEGTSYRIRGLAMKDRGVPREGYTVKTPRGDGIVTSGGYSPVLKKGIALAFIPAEVEEGSTVEIIVRGKAFEATVTAIPFV